MTLIVFAALGLALGHWLGTARSGFVTMAAVSVGSVVLEIWLLFTSTSREWMTMLPVIIGAIVACVHAPRSVGQTQEA